MFAKKEKKEQNLTLNTIRVRIKRLLNNTPVEIAVFEADIIRDKDNNIIIKNEDNFFKEDLAFIKEPLVEDILRKVKNRFASKTEQIKLLADAIEKQEDKCSRIVAGKLRPKVEKGQVIPEDKDWEKVNKITEDCRLRILKVTKFTLENEGEGSFEQIEMDGMRCITYIAQDSHLTPIYIKVPNDPKSNEPITMYKDESLKRKYQKEATDIITADYMESMNDNVSKTLSLVAKVLLVILVLGNIFLFMSNLNRTKEIDEERNLLLEEYKNTPAGICNEAVSIATKSITGQIENNGVLIDYAKKILSDEINKTKVSKTPENSNILKI